MRSFAVRAVATVSGLIAALSPDVTSGAAHGTPLEPPPARRTGALLWNARLPSAPIAGPARQALTRSPAPSALSAATRVSPREGPVPAGSPETGSAGSDSSRSPAPSEPSAGLPAGIAATPSPGAGATPYTSPRPKPAPPPAADVSVSMTGSPAVAQPGRPVSYVVRVRNRGPGPAVRPTVRVRVSETADIVAVDVAECRARGRVEVVCASPYDVKPGGTGQVTVTTVPREGARGRLRAEATITARNPDPAPGDTRAVVDTPLGPGADLGVRMAAAGVRRVRPGQRFGAVATVVNRGPQRVRDATVVLQPTRLAFRYARGARCREQGRTVLCRVGRLDSGARRAIRLGFRVPALPRKAVTVIGDAIVFSVRLGDAHPANNTSVMRLRVARPARAQAAAGTGSAGRVRSAQRAATGTASPASRNAAPNTIQPGHPQPLSSSVDMTGVTTWASWYPVPYMPWYWPWACCGASSNDSPHDPAAWRSSPPTWTIVPATRKAIAIHGVSP
ncbi:hypothetical protein [Bailinhaonella thermotolerans]|uniref:hypothetical protein n=1 Tax=Bailinhaonella thermotolerans TaxID=1070861 RepID=UPI001F5BDD34|nr:hypothetical protein [Bailinhaonella thermotolerans]